MEDDINRFRSALSHAVGHVWPITLINDLTGERIRKPMFNSMTCDSVGSVIRVRGEFYDGFSRTVAVPLSAAIASPSLAATGAVKQIMAAREHYDASPTS